MPNLPKFEMGENSILCCWVQLLHDRGDDTIHFSFQSLARKFIIYSIVGQVTLNTATPPSSFVCKVMDAGLDRLPLFHHVSQCFTHHFFKQHTHDMQRSIKFIDMILFIE